jgi:hypothetical protein
VSDPIEINEIEHLNLKMSSSSTIIQRVNDYSKNGFEVLVAIV